MNRYGLLLFMALFVATAHLSCSYDDQKQSEDQNNPDVVYDSEESVDDELNWDETADDFEEDAEEPD